MPTPTGRQTFLCGMLALFLPALCLLFIWFVSLDKDLALLLYAGIVVLSALPAPILAVRRLRRRDTGPDRALVWVGLVLGVCASAFYLIGGLAFALLLASVLGHD